MVRLINIVILLFIFAFLLHFANHSNIYLIILKAIIQVIIKSFFQDQLYQNFLESFIFCYCQSNLNNINYDYIMLGDFKILFCLLC